MAECLISSNPLESLGIPDNMDKLSGPEKLVICVDSVCLSNDFKKILTNFLEVKCFVNRHEVSLAVMTPTDVNWICEVQTDTSRSNVNEHWGANKYYGEQNHLYHQDKTFDLSKVFRLVLQRAQSFQDPNVSLRVIILFGQVNYMPIVQNTDALESLQRNLPLFTLDVLYIPHYSVKCGKMVMVDERRKAKSIFEALIGISNEKSYVFAVDETAKIAAYVLKFLAHPALRQAQKSEWFE